MVVEPCDGRIQGSLWYFYSVGLQCPTESKTKTGVCESTFTLRAVRCERPCESPVGQMPFSSLGAPGTSS